jgi:hypothetical protein
LHGRAFIKRYGAVSGRQRGEICKARLAFNSLRRREDAGSIGFLGKDES